MRRYVRRFAYIVVGHYVACGSHQMPDITEAYGPSAIVSQRWGGKRKKKAATPVQRLAA